ncbi:hypothetical protein GCM10010149_51210 [Nonomuraea roseoviolacea subsp. roseoviolacea]|uniref:Ricin B lectin domain-containing protein n=1 Tax=Nonomuraea roseoviolacea subsp. carminata TaxID=160689 RepID=A0ABT1K240_9ACTN|nr:RICIN domain-containing protein [Nonomuraea roseoviolacea]MCP2347556.1 hypothetical protein [Nonomuraea roseoviolacea subsp. carminata]
MKLITKLVATVAAGVVMTAAAAPAQAAMVGQLVNWGTGKCLAIGNSSTANGARAIQWQCLSSSPGQFWQLREDRVRPGAMEIVNRHSGLCLAVANGSGSDGAAIIQWTCNGHDSQLWRRFDEQFVNWGSGKCVAVPASTTANGAELIQWTCNDSYGQKWDR